MPTERQKSILAALVREYVATAEPVASEQIVRKYRMALSPATVRNELQALDEAGYLTQPHTSAGRIPTDKGYRFYISRIDRREAIVNREERALEEIRMASEPAEFLKQASRVLAQITGNFVLTGFPEDELFYKSGISEVMREPEFSDMRMMHEFGMLMDMLEDEISRWFDLHELEEPRTLIGAENPIRSARHYGMIISTYDTPFEKEGIVALIGPKRMDYEHNLAVLRHLREMLTS